MKESCEQETTESCTFKHSRLAALLHISITEPTIVNNNYFSVVRINGVRICEGLLCCVCVCVCVYLLKHEGILNTVNWHILRLDKTEHLEEQFSLNGTCSTLNVLHGLQVVPV